MKSLRVGIIALFLFSSTASWALDLACNHLVPIQMRFLARHVNYSQLNRNLEVRTVEQFIKHLDGSKIYFTQADIDQIKSSMNGIFDKTRQGECKPIFAAYELLKVRINENITLAKAYLGKDFKFDPKTKLVLDGKKRQFGKTKKEVEDFQKKYIQLQVANYVATDVKENEAREKVLKNYERAAKRVTEDKPTEILANYLDSFSSALDPHSTFWSKEAFEEFEISIRLSLEGIGATLSSKDGYTTIEELIPGGSAGKSGQLKPKDIILAVGQGDDGAFEDVFDQELRDVVRKIRGKKGSKVRLKILRKGSDGTKNFTVSLVRDKISIEDEAASIHYSDREVDGKKMKIALVNLPSFYADNRSMERSSASDMKKLMREARQNNVDAMVVDLSSNGGGSLQDAVDIAGLFFKEGNVVKQSSRDPSGGEVVLFDKDPFVDWAGPLVILTSRVTASASEIVSGTLKDYKRAVIVGADHTFGKGTVQAVEDLPQKLGALKTTIGLYFIPGGSSTQHIGVNSDIELPSTLTTEEIGEKTLDYSLPPRKIKPFLSAEAYTPAGRGAWEMVDSKLIAKLKMASEKRVAADPEFKKIKEEIVKNKKRENGEILLANFLKDKEDTSKEDKEAENKTYEQNKQARKEKYLKRADIVEAINIATDLAVLQKGGTTLQVGVKEASKKAEAQVNPKSTN